MTLADLIFIEGKRPKPTWTHTEGRAALTPAAGHRAHRKRLLQAQNNAMLKSETAVTVALRASIKRPSKLYRHLTRSS